ncbi:ribonuclease BN/unknown domain fusion protein [Terricaulis silvestris]|uniref:YihY family inner membrane protein n=1 Tax=Terricaulis silvestris TaxID=2686094 RepID=A0A6I6MNS7_9CAUL|nr:ribonuclease BN/unknown domain fusion protein [Terricaulis silvestris]
MQGVGATAERANLALISAGVAFFALMAVIPGLAAVAALVGVFGDPAWIGQQIEALGGIAPDAVVTIIHEQVSRLLLAQEDTLLAGAAFNLLLALWSAVQGTRWVLMALTAVNRRAEQRKVLGRFLAAGMFTLYGLGLSVLAVLLMGVAPVALTLLNLTSGVEVWLLVLRWPVLGGAAIAVALILYRWGPRRRPPPWRWLVPGAIFAPLLWLIASSALTFALREFPAFGAAYGSLASVVALLLWLYITALVFLLGGALNAELEFFALGKPAQPVVAGESIEPPIAADGGQKQVTGR